MSKALILDFGGVVTRTLFETHDITERALGLPLEALAGRDRSILPPTRSGCRCRRVKLPNAITG